MSTQPIPGATGPKSVEEVARYSIAFDPTSGSPVSPAGSPKTYTEVAGSPFTLTSAWSLVTTTTSASRGLILSDASQSAYDIFWTVTTAGAGTPSASVLGVGVLGGEDFASGLPLGDIYLRSASGAKATVEKA